MYDGLLEGLYRDAREHAVAFCAFPRGAQVVDLACGTGASFPMLVQAVGPAGRVVGVDASEGMLRAARRRIDRAGWAHVTVDHGHAEAADLTQADAVFCALGLTVIPNWRTVLDRMRQQLRPGGRIGVLDVHAAGWNPQRPVVEWMAGADLSRPIREAVQERFVDCRVQALPGSPWVFGGRLFVVTARVP